MGIRNWTKERAVARPRLDTQDTEFVHISQTCWSVTINARMLSHRPFEQNPNFAVIKRSLEYGKITRNFRTTLCQLCFAEKAPFLEKFGNDTGREGGYPEIF